MDVELKAVVERLERIAGLVEHRDVADAVVKVKDLRLVLASLQAPCLGNTIRCSKCGNPDSQMCDCSLPGPSAQPVPSGQEVFSAGFGAMLSASPGKPQDGEAQIAESDIPEIVERGARREALTIAEQAAWSGYELGWRDGHNDAHPNPNLLADSQTSGGET